MVKHELQAQYETEQQDQLRNTARRIFGYIIQSSNRITKDIKTLQDKLKVIDDLRSDLLAAYDAEDMDLVNEVQDKFNTILHYNCGTGFADVNTAPKGWVGTIYGFSSGEWSKTTIPERE